MQVGFGAHRSRQDDDRIGGLVRLHLVLSAQYSSARVQWYKGTILVQRKMFKH